MIYKLILRLRICNRQSYGRVKQIVFFLIFLLNYANSGQEDLFKLVIELECHHEWLKSV
ncbi:hypothetical protein SRABI96_03128 [Peribacillus sp. Bi96]|nr:hypothetical protein SRABI96_03128 [Peribacillus sp. Bi96]